MGIVLITTELLLPEFVLLFFGIAALFVGILLAGGVPMPLWLSVTLFAALSLFQVLFVRRFFKIWFTGRNIQDADDLEDFLGCEASVVAGFGKDSQRDTVEFCDTPWDATSLLYHPKRRFRDRCSHRPDQNRTHRSTAPAIRH